jgi:hypothetical protein
LVNAATPAIVKADYGVIPGGIIDDSSFRRPVFVIVLHRLIIFDELWWIGVGRLLGTPKVSAVSRGE